MKRHISLLVVLLMIMSVLALSSCEQEGIFIYELNKEGDGYIISALIKNPLTVIEGDIIPSTHNGLPVKEIKKGGFAGWTNLYIISIPGSVEKIGNYAFGSSGVVFVYIGEGTKYIDDYAFAYSSSMEEIVLPDTIEYIGKGAFAFCTFLNNIYYSGTVSEWHAIEKEDGWNAQMGVLNFVTVSCSDGVVTFYSPD